MASLGGAGWAGIVDRRLIGSAYSAPALYNLGNFYARAGRPAMAVLNYERARILAPTDPDIQENLSHVRESVGLPALHAGWLSQHDRLADPNTLYWIGVFGLAITGVTLLLRRARSKHRALLAAARSSAAF
jgi:tetratricopeptide (TPR) repeat protein